VLHRWFDRKRETAASPQKEGLSGPRVPRHSGAWSVLRKRLQAGPGLRVIDTGYTSPANINYLTSLGQSVFLADLVYDVWTGDWRRGEDEDGNQIWDVDGFFEQSLNFAGRTFDVVLLWTTLDYLPEAVLAPLVARLYQAMNPGGQVMAFFHTRTQGDDIMRFRYHLTPGDDVDMQMTQQFPIQRAFTNRSIERLFTGWSGHRQFLAKDSVSEVIITR
jgi:hypothetical protein